MYVFIHIFPIFTKGRLVRPSGVQYETSKSHLPRTAQQVKLRFVVIGDDEPTNDLTTVLAAFFGRRAG